MDMAGQDETVPAIILEIPLVHAQQIHVRRVRGPPFFGSSRLFYERRNGKNQAGVMNRLLTTNTVKALGRILDNPVRPLSYGRFDPLSLIMDFNGCEVQAIVLVT